MRWTAWEGFSSLQAVGHDSPLDIVSVLVAQEMTKLFDVLASD